MSAEIPIRLESGFDPRPDWFKHVEEAVAEAAAHGWTLAGDIVFHGDPYIWEGEPRTATWTLCPDPCPQHPA